MLVKHTFIFPWILEFLSDSIELRTFIAKPQAGLLRIQSQISTDSFTANITKDPSGFNSYPQSLRLHYLRSDVVETVRRADIAL